MSICHRRKRRLVLGRLTLCIIYGKDRRAIMDTPLFVGDILGIFSMMWLWGILGLFFGEINLIYLMVWGSYPAVITIWAVIARKRYRKVANILAAMDRESANSAVNSEDAFTEEPDPTKPVLAKYLQCPDCGRRQLSSRTDCWNCKRVFEAQDYEYIELKPLRQESEGFTKVKKKYLLCPNCGRTQLSTRTDCWNCKRVFEEQDYEYE